MNFGGLHPALQPYAQWLFDAASRAGLRPRITSTLRTRRQQEVLYSRYLRGLNPYPVAPPGQSLHELGLAFDLVSDDNAQLGEAWRWLGGRWGGQADWVHFDVG